MLSYDKILTCGDVLRKIWPDKGFSNVIHTLLSHGENDALYKHKKYGEILDDILGRNRTVKNTIKFITSYSDISNINYIIILVTQILNYTGTYDKYYRIKRRYMKHLLELSKNDDVKKYMIAYMFIFHRVPFMQKMIFHKIMTDLDINAVLGMIGLFEHHPKYIVKAINKSMITAEDILKYCHSYNFNIRILKLGIKKFDHGKHLKHYYTDDYTRKALYCYNKYGKNIEINPDGKSSLVNNRKSMGYMILSRRYQGMKILDNSKMIHRISTISCSIIFRRNLAKMASYYV
jgi:hypothetical protein